MISLTQTLALAALLLGAGDGRSTRSYDSAGNLLKTVDAGGHATTFGVNASGQVTAKTGPQPGEAWTFEYDVFGQLKKKSLVRGSGALAGWQGASWSYQYKLEDGATVEETGPGGYATRRWYNAQHQLLKEVRSDVGAARSSLNELTMTQVWDGPYLKSREEKEGTWVKTISRPRYDHRGRVLEEKEAFVGAESSVGYTYTTNTPWSGRTAAVQQSWATQTKSGSRIGSLAVDGLGNTIEQSWGVYSDQWKYDAAGRLVSEKLSGKPERTLHYVEGLADQETYGSAETTSYQYWASGKAWTRSDPDGRERRLTWDERGLLKKEEYGRGGSYDTRQYGYDEAGQRSFLLVGVAPDEAQWAYANGPRGELLSVTQPGTTGGTFQYEYDERAQLASVTPPAGSASAAQAFGYAQQRWYQPEVGRFLSEDPLGASAERLREPGRLQAFAYAAGNPLLFIDPLGLDVGQPESTSGRAQEDMRYQAGLNENNKGRGNWAQGCAAGLADNWKNVDGGAMEAGYLCLPKTSSARNQLSRNVLRG